METYDDPVPKKNKGENLTEKRKSKSVKTVTGKVGHTDGIDRLNLTGTVHELDNHYVHDSDSYSE